MRGEVLKALLDCSLNLCRPKLNIDGLRKKLCETALEATAGAANAGGHGHGSGATALHDTFSVNTFGWSSMDPMLLFHRSDLNTLSFVANADFRFWSWAVREGHVDAHKKADVI